MTPFRAFAVWVLLFVIAVMNGTLRESVFRRFFDELAAHQISCVTGILLILLAVRLAGRKWRFKSTRQAWTIGFVWLFLTIAWEFAFGHFVMGHPWARLVQDYAVWNGRFWVFVLLAILLAPLVSWIVNRGEHQLQ